MNPDVSKEHEDGEKRCNFALPYPLTMDVGEWLAYGSIRFIPDVPCTEICFSLDTTTVVIINYWKMAQN